MEYKLFDAIIKNAGFSVNYSYSGKISKTGKNHTMLIVAHRLSTIRNADRIMLVGDKTILTSGTHEELMDTCEKYRNLYRFERGEGDHP